MDDVCTAAIVVREFEWATPVLSLVLITGTDGATDTVAFAIVDVEGGALFQTVDIPCERVMKQDPDVLRGLDGFGLIWGLKAADFLRHIVRHDPRFAQAA